MDPLVTVLISSYNHEKYIAECVESVLNQTYENLQILVIDDGSSDDTLDILKKYNDERMEIFVSQENTSFRFYEQVINEKVKGKYIAEIPSDDQWTPDKISKQVDFLENNPKVNIVFSWCEVLTEDSQEKERLEKIFNNENKERHEWFHELIVEGNKLNNPSVMFRSDVYYRYHGYRFQYRQLQDLELWLRVLQNEEIYIMPEKLTYYCWHPQDKVENMSQGTVDNLSRLDTELSYILFDVFRNVDGDFFNHAFYRELQGDTSLDEADVICKKFLILACFNSSVFQDAAMLFYYEFNRKKGVLETLENKYGFTRGDFWQYVGEHGSVHDMMEYRRLANRWRDAYNQSKRN